MGQMTVLTGPERRRRWSDEQRVQILTEAFAPGASPTEVARRHEVSTGQLYTWRRKRALDAAMPLLNTGHALGFSEAVVIEDRERAVSVSGTPPVVDLPRGRRVTILPSASPALAAAVLKALR